MAFGQGFYQPPVSGVYPSVRQPYNPAPYQQQMPVYQTQETLVGRMVTSREEALAVPVDFQSGVTFMPDLSHGRVYAKIFNQQTGGADFVEFAAMPKQGAADNVPAFAPLSVVDDLRRQVDELKGKLERLTEPRKAAENG